MKNFFLAALIGLSAIGCIDKDQDTHTLPDATQEGKNTGGALVDGQVWVAKIQAPDSKPGGNNTTYDYLPISNIHHVAIVLRSLESPETEFISIDFTSSQQIIPGNTYQLTNDSEDRGIYGLILGSSY